jgi:hypothetical protein
MKCGANLFWQDFLGTVVPGVPENPRAVTEYMNHYFAKPARLPHEIVIAVESDGFNPLSRKGGLIRVSPEEPVHAWALAVARDIDLRVDDNVLKQWRYHSLTVTFHFECLASEDEKFYRAANLREAPCIH